MRPSRRGRAFLSVARCYRRDDEPATHPWPLMLARALVDRREIRFASNVARNIDPRARARPGNPLAAALLDAEFARTMGRNNRSVSA